MIYLRMCMAAIGCLFLWAGIAASEPVGTSITGVITGPDGARLPGALVTVRTNGADDSVQAVSSSSGTYRMPELRAGSYELTAELTGFEAFRLQDVRIDADVHKTIDLSMNLSTIKEVVTVMGALRRDSLEAPETRESSARDVGEAMPHMPGVWKLRKGGIANDIVIRGVQSKDLNVLIDGQRIYGACPNHMDPTAFHVDFSEVDRVEIGKGPFDMKNQGSLGGVVNIVTRKAEPGFHVFGNLATGSYGFMNPSATLSYAHHGSSILAGYSYRLSSPYNDGSGKRFTESVNFKTSLLDSDAFRIGTVWAKASASPAAGHLAQFSYARQEADHVLYPYLQMDAVYDDTDRFNAGYQINDMKGLVRSLRFQVYFTEVNHWMTDRYRISSLNVVRDYSMGTLAGTEALGGRFETAFKDLTLGVEAFHRGWDAATQLAGAAYAPQYSIPDVRTGSFGLYSEYSRPLSDNIKLSLGGRIDSVTTAADTAKANTSLYFAYNSTRSTSRTNNYPSGSVRLGYKTAFGLEIGGGAGHTVRVPDARERYFALKRMGTDWVGNPELKPSRSTGFDTAVSYRRKGLLLESNLYLNYIDDYVTVVGQAKSNIIPGVMNAKSRSYQNADARIYGSEILVSYLFSRRIFVSSDLSYVRGTRNVDAGPAILSSNIPEIPPVRSRTALRYDAGRYFGEIEAVFAGAQDNVDTLLGEQRTAGYGIANLKLGAAYNRFALKLSIDNLLGRRYFEHLSYQRDPFRSGARIFEPGRNFMVNLSFRY